MPLMKKPAFGGDLPLPMPMMAAGPPMVGLGAKLLSMIRGGPKAIPPPTNLPPPPPNLTAGARMPEFTAVGDEALYNASQPPRFAPKNPLDGIYDLIMQRFGGGGR